MRENLFITMKPECIGIECRHLSVNGCSHPLANKWTICPIKEEEKLFNEEVDKAYNELCKPLPDSTALYKAILQKLENSHYSTKVGKSVIKRLDDAMLAQKTDI